MGYLMFLAGAAILCAAVDGKKRIWQRLNITHGIDFRRFLLALVAGVVIVLGTIGELWREFREEEPDTWKGDET